MKELRTYINESIFDVDDNIDKVDVNTKIHKTQEYLSKYYCKSKWDISKKLNNEGKVEVSSNDNVLARHESGIRTLTNEYFVFKTIHGNFDVSECLDLETLKGAPKIIYGDFCCYDCPSLKRLDTDTIQVTGNFDISNCTELESLEGSPKEVNKYFVYYHAGGSISGKSKKYKTPWTERDVKKYTKLGKGVISKYEDA